MKLGLIFGKTEAGRLEIADRSGSLNAVQRRLLVVIDGKKTVNDLALFVRVGELEPALAHLEQQGLIQSDQTTVDLILPIASGFTARASENEIQRPATSLERHAFYAAAESAYAIVQTCERRFYGNILLTKGVIAPDVTLPGDRP